MCVGGLFGGGRKPMPQPQRQAPAPTMQAAAPPPEMVSPETIKEEEGEEKLSTKKRKLSRLRKLKKVLKPLELLIQHHYLTHQVAVSIPHRR